MSSSPASDVPVEAAASGATRSSYFARMLSAPLRNSPVYLWAFSGLLLCGIALWAFFDPQFEITAGLAPPSVQWAFSDTPELRNERFVLTSPALMIGFLALTIFALLVAGFWVGTKDYRSLKSMLVFMTLVGLWLGLIMSLPEIAWYGKQWRVGRLLNRLEPIVAELREDWPTTDGSSPTLGPFKSYPLTQPTTLMLMVSPPLPESGVRLTQVERADSGALRFLLAGSEVGDWVEWHPEGSSPASYRSGLGPSHELHRYTDFGNGWYLARYLP